MPPISAERAIPVAIIAIPPGDVLLFAKAM
jgi:hypothetical protein